MHQQNGSDCIRSLARLATVPPTVPGVPLVKRERAGEIERKRGKWAESAILRFKSPFSEL